MKNIKTYINESLFAGSIDDKISDINSSLVLPQPKNAADYLNYISVWVAWMHKTYQVIRYMKSNEEVKEFLDYLFNLYIENLPKYHIDIAKLRSLYPSSKSGILYDIKYDMNYEDKIVQSGEVKCNRSDYYKYGHMELDTKSNGRSAIIYIIINVMLGLDPYDKSPGYITSLPKIVLHARFLGLSRPSITGASFFIMNIKNTDQDEKKFYQQSKRQKYWVEAIRNAVLKSPYKDLIKNFDLRFL